MPRHDAPDGRRRQPGRVSLPGRHMLAWLKSRRHRRGRDDEDGGVPVEPNRPNSLSGGAAAALDFDR